MKRVVKGFFAFLVSVTYVWLMFLTAASFALRYTVVESSTPKKWLDQSGVYEKAVEEVAKLATIQQAQDSAVIEITSEDIVNSAQTAFPSDELKRSAEGIIDGFYGWFKGDTTNPDFRIDFQGEKQAFARNMTAVLESKIKELPECTTSSSFTLQAFDPFKAECRPKGIDLTKQLTDFENDIANTNDFLPQTVFTGGDVKVNKNGNSERIGSALPWVPKAYKGLLYAPWALLAITVLSTAMIMLLSTSRRRGLRRIASTHAFAGAVLVISGFFLSTAIQKLNSWSTGSFGASESITNNIINPLFAQIDKSFSRYNIIIGVVFLAVSLLCYGILLLTRGRAAEDVQEEPIDKSDESIVLHDEADATTPYFDQSIVEATEERGRPEFITDKPTQTPVYHHRVQPSQPPEPTPSQPMHSTVPSVPRPEHASITPHAPMAGPPRRPVTRRPPMIQG